jgi:CRISPR/Cas system CMR-associated protein Cmr3 (group 5 of RAMP superfamily)
MAEARSFAPMPIPDDEITRVESMSLGHEPRWEDFEHPENHNFFRMRKRKIYTVTMTLS